MTDVITLSSSDEDEISTPPRKKIKPTFLNEISIIPIEKLKKSDNSEDVVVLSDEDDSETIQSTKILTNGHNEETIECNLIIKDDDNDSVTFIEDKDESEINVKNGNESSVRTNETPTKEGQECLVIENLEEDEKECCIINDVSQNDSSTESSGKENKSENILPVNNVLENPSTSSNASYISLENFLNVCGDTIRNSPYEHLRDKQFLMLRKYFKKCSMKLRESSSFLKLINENLERVQKSPAAAVISFNEIFQYVKELVDAESIEVPEENRIRLRKLEKTIKLLVAKIKHLEEEEIDFNDEEDSSYLMLDRFINRLNKVHGKYCQLLKKNPYTGRITYEKLDFVHSEYNDINKAINKKYKNNKKFPSYIEMEELVKKVVAEHNLALSEAKIKTESVHCFKKLGELLQTRRKKELYDAHYLYIRDSEDPANKDTSLDSTLKQNFSEGQVKIEKLCDEYTVKEKLGVEVELSEEDSDKSDYVDSETEEKNDNLNE